MNARFPNSSPTKAAISVTEMARLVGMSRNHFFTLCKKGVFPMPVYALSNRRPFFDIDAQQECLRVRASNIGANGQYVMFYPPRNKQPDSPTEASSRKVKPTERAVELAKALKHLGLAVTPQQVDAAVAEVYPDGPPSEDGVVVRALFLHWKRPKGG